MNYRERYDQLTAAIDQASKERAALMEEWASHAPWKKGDVIQEEHIDPYGERVVGPLRFQVEHVSVCDRWWGSRGEPRFVASGPGIRKDGSIGVRQISAVRKP